MKDIGYIYENRSVQHSTLCYLQLYRKINQVSVLHLLHLLVLIASYRSFAKMLHKTTLSSVWLKSQWAIWSRQRGQQQIITSGLSTNLTESSFILLYDKLVIEISKWALFFSSERRTATSTQTGNTALRIYWTCSSEKISLHFAFFGFFVWCF